MRRSLWEVLNGKFSLAVLSCCVLAGCQALKVDVKPVNVDVRPVSTPVGQTQELEKIPGERDVYIDIENLVISVRGPAGSGRCSKDGAFNAGLAKSVRASFLNLVNTLYESPNVIFSRHDPDNKGNVADRSYTSIRPTSWSANITSTKSIFVLDIRYFSRVSMIVTAQSANAGKYNEVLDADVRKTDTGVFGFDGAACRALGTEFSRMLREALRKGIDQTRAELLKYHAKNTP